MRAHSRCVLILAITAACAPKLPPERPAAALYRDLRRLVTLSGAAGWEVDRIEVEDMMPDALMSVCRVDPAGRSALLSWLDAGIAEAGGDPRAAYLRAGGDIDDIDDLLELWRIRLVLARATELAAADCPFWIRPERAFAGRQVIDDSWVLSFGGGGKGIVVVQGDATDLNFGGAGRLLLGRAFGTSWTVLAGVEAGASASFPRDSEGERGSLVLGIDLVAPVVARYRLVNSYAEAELGFLTVVRETETGDPEPGIHVGVAFGAGASRRRWVLPGVALGLSYERTFPDGADDPLHMFKLGLRAAIDVGW